MSVTPPELVQFGMTTWNAYTVRSAGNFSWLTGDIIVVIQMNENSQVIAKPSTTGAGLDFSGTPVASFYDAGYACGAEVWAITATADGSGTISGGSDNSNFIGAAVWQWRNSDGIGTHFVSVVGDLPNKTMNAIPTGPDSAWCLGVGDYAAATPAGSALTPVCNSSNGYPNGSEYTGRYTIYVGEVDDLASEISTAFGISAGTSSSGSFTKIGIEVRGHTSTLTLQTVKPDADVATTGWETAPLFSKINDGSDATMITGILS
jgi:hypothetical protein